MNKLRLYEKAGYACGDAAANFVWRSTFFLPIFYTDTFGLAAAQVAVLILIIRLSDGVTDIFMGAVADRTETKNGKFRPWVIWSAPILALFLGLLFTTPDLSDSGKLVYAYVIYFGLTLAYTANNVPYGALLGVMTPSVKERSLLSSYRFAGAFAGGLLVMALMPILVPMLGDGTSESAEGYKYTVMIFAVLLLIFNVITYFTTTERVKPTEQNQGKLGEELWDLVKNLPIILIPVAGVSIFLISLTQTEWSDTTRWLCALFCLGTFAAAVLIRKQLLNKPIEALTHTQKDLRDLMSNTPWLVLLIVGIMFGLFTVVRPSAASYYIKYVMDSEAAIVFGFQMSTAGLISTYFTITLIASLIAAFVVGHLTKTMAKKPLMVIAFIGGGIASSSLFFLGGDQVGLMLVMSFISEFFAGMLPILFFSMLGDSADYSEWKNNRRATGLVFSAGTFINKSGHGFAGAVVLIVLTLYGYDAADEASIEGSLEGIKLLMSFIPAIICAIGAAALAIYPLSDDKMEQIEQDLADRRKANA